MKKVITIISCCIIIFSIGGCMNREKYMSDWFTSEQEEADKMMEQIIEACRKQDTQKRRKTLSRGKKAAYPLFTFHNFFHFLSPFHGHFSFEKIE